MLKLIAAVSVLVLSLVACNGDSTTGSKTCTTGKPCGNTCISKSDTCHK